MGKSRTTRLRRALLSFPIGLLFVLDDGEAKDALGLLSVVADASA